jgi:hypothetical protein
MQSAVEMQETPDRELLVVPAGIGVGPPSQPMLYMEPPPRWDNSAIALPLPCPLAVHAHGDEVHDTLARLPPPVNPGIAKDESAFV